MIPGVTDEATEAKFEQELAAYIETNPETGCFGIPLGDIPMGTLGEVAGRERAQEVFDLLAEQRRNNSLALARLGIRSPR